MSDLSPGTEPPPAPEPSLPIPVRRSLSRRTRNWLLLAMLGALVAVVVVAIVAAVSSSPPPERAVTVSAEDRNAPVELRRAAGAIGFAPVEQSGVGAIEARIHALRDRSDPCESQLRTYQRPPSSVA